MSPPPPARQVFISHSATDRAAAEAIRAALEASGTSCWIAPRDIPPGAEWADAIMAGIAEARLVLLIHSAASAASQMVRREVNVAVDGRTPVIPVRIDSALPQDGMQFYLGGTHWLDASAGELAGHLGRIVAAVAEQLRPAGARNMPVTTPALALPDKPSLVVLPFQNMSGDPEQEYFADGMVEDITTALSRIGGLFVIARNSAFTFKGKPIDVKQVGRDLGVRYIVEGSVRKAEGRVRITAQLIEAATATHLWADRFDGPLDDIFDLQDRVTESIVGAIEPSLKRAEISRAAAKPTGSLNAYDLYLRALPEHYSLVRPRMDRCIALLREALALAPGFTLARALLANAYGMRHHIGGDAPGDDAIALDLAHEVLASRTDDPDALRLAAVTVGYFSTEYPLALAALRRALLLHPNSAQVLNMLGWVEIWAGEAQSAVEHFRRAMHLSPLDPEIGYMLGGLGVALLMLDRDAEAMEVLRRAVEESPNFTANHSNLVLALHRAGRLEEAKAAAERLLALYPGYRVRRVKATFNPRYKADLHAALLAAGLPE